MVLFAAILNELHRVGGRSCVGAAMVSKNLKATAEKPSVVREQVPYRLEDLRKAPLSSPVPVSGCRCN